MGKLRIIPRLDIKNYNLVKTINLDGLRVLGEPNKFAKDYYKDGADELLFLDSVARLYGRNSIGKIISNLSKDIFIPVTVGGGIRSVKDASNLFKSGADKIAINTAALERPKLIQKLSNEFGSQAIVLSIEAKKYKENKWMAYKNNGRDNSNIDVVDWVKKASALGAGEILLTSIDNEGMFKGLDFDLYNTVSKVTNIPIILGGGANNLENIIQASNKGLDGVAISGLFHYKKISINSLKKNFK